MKTPVLFLIFNRPELTTQAFESIRKAKPTQLFVAADGPRENRSNEPEKCELARKIATNVDWHCEVKTLFRDHNLGCGKAVSEAITWFFEHVEEGIILEDDCVPHESFFSFCSELLLHYKTNKKVLHISGNNFQDGIWRGDGSYYFSHFSHIWGWATWRRAWALYDFDIKSFPDFERRKLIYKLTRNREQAKFWLQNFRTAFSKSVDTWDHSWSYTVFKNHGLSILPNKNLVTNIGFGPSATHTVEKNIKLEQLPIDELGLIVHPSNLSVNRSADKYTFKALFYQQQPIILPILRKIKSNLKIQLNWIHKISSSIPTK